LSKLAEDYERRITVGRATCEEGDFLGKVQCILQHSKVYALVVSETKKSNETVARSTLYLELICTGLNLKDSYMSQTQLPI